MLGYLSKDKYPSIFSHKMGAIVFIILQIFFATHAVLKIEGISSDMPKLYLGHIRSRDAFRPIALERKYLMDYKDYYYLPAPSFCSDQ